MQGDTVTSKAFDNRATAIYLTRSGIPTGVISVATRYIHLPVEMLSISDIDKAAELMARSLETATRYFEE